MKNLTYPYMGVAEVKNSQNHPYVINEWPLEKYLYQQITRRSANEELSYRILRVKRLE